jgi:TetR/AcrR family transcriptional regulator, lmrAB and yxaGH operons repressor
VKKKDTRTNIVLATARLLSERGFAAMGTDDIVAMSRSPKGSLYYYFPGGKEEMAVAALRHSGDEWFEAMRASFAESTTVQGGLHMLIEDVQGMLATFDYGAGCAVGILAAEAPKSRVLGRTVTAIFDQWEGGLRDRLVKAGVTGKRAAELAAFLLAVVEGALLLSKARRSCAPLDNAMTEIARLLRNEQIA